MCAESVEALGGVCGSSGLAGGWDGVMTDHVQVAGTGVLRPARCPLPHQQGTQAERNPSKSSRREPRSILGAGPDDTGPARERVPPYAGALPPWQDALVLRDISVWFLLTYCCLHYRARESCSLFLGTDATC